MQIHIDVDLGMCIIKQQCGSEWILSAPSGSEILDLGFVGAKPETHTTEGAPRGREMAPIQGDV